MGKRKMSASLRLESLETRTTPTIIGAFVPFPGGGVAYQLQSDNPAVAVNITVENGAGGSDLKWTGTEAGGPPQSGTVSAGEIGLAVLVSGQPFRGVWMVGGSGADTLTATNLSNFVARLDGGAGNDTLNSSTTQPNTLNGGDGNDTINAKGGDTVTGGAGNDSFNFFGTGGVTFVDDGGGNDTITGTAGNDNLTGAGGNDTINGGAGNDTINGAGGNDTLNGGDGDDTIRGGAGNDTIDGGAGNNTIDLSDATTGLSVDLRFQVMAGGDVGTDTFSNIQNAIGGSGEDFLVGSNGANRLEGRGGDDTLFGLGGADNLLGGDGNDTADGGRDNDTVSGGAGDDFLNGGDGNDTVSGNEGNDDLYGQRGMDRMDGGLGADYVDGGNGADTLVLDWNQFRLGAGGDPGAQLDLYWGGAEADIFEVNNLYVVRNIVGLGERQVLDSGRVAEFFQYLNLTLLPGNQSDMDLDIDTIVFRPAGDPPSPPVI